MRKWCLCAKRICIFENPALKGNLTNFIHSLMVSNHFQITQIEFCCPTVIVCTYMLHSHTTNARFHYMCCMFWLPDITSRLNLCKYYLAVLLGTNEPITTAWWRRWKTFAANTMLLFSLFGHLHSSNNYSHYKRLKHMEDEQVGVEWNRMFLHAGVF